ncbi:hypothetical protein AVEN_54370-1 [Araneus ventricosus]|uniref:Uncharacterized protein n=1 Tax=Araneus ventricosus TaxID=182803 RepID=A0A4Y2ASF8_ARAVE|nr:hypothetical protein AVEN_18795-1 [Araneus ventricosus]GBL82803.1 hypothetical protein AVEN_54370-1 [Araneus ventricosus]
MFLRFCSDPPTFWRSQWHSGSVSTSGSESSRFEARFHQRSGLLHAKSYVVGKNPPAAQWCSFVFYRVKNHSDETKNNRDLKFAQFKGMDLMHRLGSRV